MSGFRDPIVPEAYAAGWRDVPPDDRAASDADDALLFVHGVGTRYFAEVVTVLRAELMATDPAQADALDRLYARLGAMRDLLEQRLAEMQQLDLTAPTAPVSEVREVREEVEAQGEKDVQG